LQKVPKACDLSDNQIYHILKILAATGCTLPCGRLLFSGMGGEKRSKKAETYAQNTQNFSQSYLFDSARYGF